MGGVHVKRSAVDIHDCKLHAVAVGEPGGDLQRRVQVLAVRIHLGVEVPVINEEIDSKIVRQRKLLLHSTVIAVLPARKGLAVLIPSV